MNGLFAGLMSLGLIMTFFAQLVVLAHDVSDKSIDFADDMVEGVDCTLQGRLLSECKPELLAVDFSYEQERFQELTQDMSSQLLGSLENAEGLSAEEEAKLEELREIIEELQQIQVERNE